MLAFAYCLGLGVPFALTALDLGWVSSALAFVRRHIRVVNIAGAAMVIILGVLMVTGVWVQWIYVLQKPLRDFPHTHLTAVEPARSTSTKDNSCTSI